MSDNLDAVSRSDILSLTARIRELETQLIRTPVDLARRGDTNACTNCDTNCTNCRGDRFIDVLLPGEDVGLSGSELVNRLRVKGPGK